jgi:hypothetical protein
MLTEWGNCMKNLIRNAAIVFLATIVSERCYSAELHNPHPNPTELRIVSMEPTPEPDHVETSIVIPENKQTVEKNPVSLQINIKGFPVGTDSDFPRKNEIYNDREGQCIHVFIDNEPYFSINEAFLDSLSNNDVYYNQSTMEFDIPFNLKPGVHVIRVFPVRSYNESLKGDNCFASSIFYLKEKSKLKGVDLAAPYLTYNEPEGEYDYSPSAPILLDFYITNCQLSKDGYKVRLSIDGHVERVITRWVPYYIYGLSKGAHKIRIELIDPENNAVPGIFNNVERTITLR